MPSHRANRALTAKHHRSKKVKRQTQPTRSCLSPWRNWPYPWDRRFDRAQSLPPRRERQNAPRRSGLTLGLSGLLVLAWLLTLLLIWGSLRVMLSVSSEPLPTPPQPGFNPVAFLEMLGALTLGCIGFSVLMTSTLKQNAQRSAQPPSLAAEANARDPRSTLPEARSSKP